MKRGCVTLQTTGGYRRLRVSHGTKHLCNRIGRGMTNIAVNSAYPTAVMGHPGRFADLLGRKVGCGAYLGTGPLGTAVAATTEDVSIDCRRLVQYAGCGVASPACSRS